MPLTRTTASTNLSGLVRSQNARVDIQVNPRVANENFNNAAPLSAAGEQETNRDMLPWQAPSSSSLRTMANTDEERQSDTSALRRIQTSAKTAVEEQLMYLKSMMRSNREPELSDMEFLPLLIKSENRLDPGLNLRLLSSPASRMDAGELMLNGVSAAVSRGNTAPWQAVLDDRGHCLAISVRHASDEPGEVSIVMIDSQNDTLGHAWVEEKESAKMTTRLIDHNARLGQARLRIHLSRLYTQAQRAVGCHIFALSAAKKAATSTAVAQLHEAGIERLKTTKDVHHSTHANAFSVLEAHFFKHATSRKTIERFLSDNPKLTDAPVNKRNDTLAGRYDRHLSQRVSQDGRSLNYSASLEMKRIALLEKALETLGDELEEKPLSYFADEQERESGLLNESSELGSVDSDFNPKNAAPRATKDASREASLS